MTAPTRVLTVKCFNPDGTACPDGTRVSAVLDQVDRYQGFIAPRQVNATTTGGIALLSLFPNAPSPVGLGTTGSTYTVTAGWAGSAGICVTCQMPDADSTLDALATGLPVASLTDAQAAIASAQAAAGAAGTSATAAANSATAAATSNSNAASNASAAFNSAGAALTRADNALTYSNVAQTAATNASSSAGGAATSAGQAAASATAADTSATNASNSATAAATSATQAAASKTAADTAAALATTNGAAQVTLAAAQATAASNNATSAGNSATAAAGSAASAVVAKTAAETARDLANQFVALCSASAVQGAAYLQQIFTTLASAAAITGAVASSASSASTAGAQASLAQSAAAAASSVVQQDLSGTVTAQALHRSPNPVTALFVYDVSKDSDGGAWPERMGWTSWMNEALNGTWRGPIAGANIAAAETTVRAISGAATGDFFQWSGDGKFYKLNAGAGTTETFRGNTAKFPKQVAIVAEAGNVTLYDLTQPGRPMWMRFNSGSGAIRTANNVGCLAMLNGELLVGGAPSGDLNRISFVKDGTQVPRDGGIVNVAYGNIAQRNGTLGFMSLTGQAQTLASRAVNAVAMTVLPNAPVDPVTGLQVPTIAVAVGTGNGGNTGTVLMNDGTAVNYTQGGNDGVAVSFTPKGEVSWGLSSSTAAYVMPLAASGPVTVGATARQYGSGSTTPSTGSAAAKRPTAAGRNVAVWGTNPSSNLVSFLRENPSTAAAGMVAAITGTYSTGWMVGDIRRSLAADTQAGATLGEQIIFANWTTGQPAAVTIGGGTVRINSTDGSYAGVVQGTAVIGKTYQYTITVTAGAAGAIAVGVTNSGSSNSTGPFYSAPGTYTGTFTATATNQFEVKRAIGGQVTDVTFSTLSIKEAVADRSVKTKNSNINGTLAMTAVASAAQLVAYSGFSAVNYVQEAYSADLDYGTGAWQAEAWVNYTTAAVSTILDRSAATGAFWTLGTDATGKLTATANDGTTTRTLTASVATNDSNWHHVRVTYSASGALTLFLDGAQNAQTTGAALLTLNNASAVFTLGNNRALSAAFPGSIALVRTGATVPFAEQIAFAYAQERAMFQPGVQVALPDTGAVLDLAYDDTLDRVKGATAANEFSFTGLVRVESQAAAAGSISKVAMRSGRKLVARTGTNPGVDYEVASINLREALLRRNEDATRLAGLALGRVFDFDAITAQTDFVLPVGWEASEVLAIGASKREGAAKDWVRIFDGFKETTRFNAAPGNAAWVQVVARRAA